MAQTIEAIYQSAIKFLTPLSSEETYNLVIEETKELVSAQFGSIFLLENKQLTRVYSTLPKEAHVIPRQNGNTVKAFKTKKIIVAKLKEIERIYPQFVPYGICSVIYLPLSYKGKTIGVLTATSKESGHFTPQKIRILQLYCSMITLAIRNTQLYSDTQKALETRDAFIAMASHELKTPLTSLIGYVQLIQTKIRSNSEVNPTWVDEMDKQSQRLSKLINEFLQIDYIKKGEIKHDEGKCSLSSITDQAVVAYGFRVGSSKIKFLAKTTTSEDQIPCDKDKLLTALITLFSEVRKTFGPSKEINIVQSQSKGGWNVTLSWKNDPEDSTAFFELINSHDVSLEFVRKIVGQHRGKFDLSNASDKNGSIRIFLPES